MMLETFRALPPGDAVPVTVDPAAVGSPAGVDSPPIDPLAQTIAVTQAKDHPALPIAPAVKDGLPEAGVGTAGNEPSAGPASESPPRTTGRFVAARPGELDEALPARPAGAWISPQTWALVIGLLAVWLLAWYMLQPPSADGLYRRIQRQTEGESAEVLSQAEDDIRQFLARFPHDPRSEGLKDYAERIEMSRLERRLELQVKGVNVHSSLSPVERTYLEALNAARADPETGIARLQAMIDLFESPTEVSGPRWRCIQLAKRRLSEVRQQYEAQSQEQRTLVEERIHRADELRKTEPQRANVMYRAVIVLYQNKAWAKDVVQRARSALEKGK
jgi:hypothetical protein